MAGEADKDQAQRADGAAAQVSALEHPMVLAALSRMASTGAWQLVLDGQPVPNGIDRVDAEFLVAAGAVERVGDGTFRLAVNDPLYRSCDALADWTRYSLRRALQHARGGGTGWAEGDPETILSFGRASGRAADIFADQLLPRLPKLAAALASGRGAFLDVGVGVGAISIRLLERFPGTSAVGIDVLPDALELARAELARSGLTQGIELRLQSVAELEDRDRYDLAWVPQPFIPRPAFLTGIANVLRALKPGGAAVLPSSPQAGTSAFALARQAHAAQLAGGSSFTRSELVEVLRASGFVDLAEHPVGPQILITAIRPAVAPRCAGAA